MNRQSVAALYLVLFSGCQTLMNDGITERRDRPLGEVVQAPFEDMIQNTRPSEQILGSVYFDFAESSLSAATKQHLDRLAAGVSQQPGFVIVEGHTDHANTESQNTRLAYQRALAVAEYLKSAGVWDERLVVRGFGENRPVASNWSDIGRAENRRVVIKLLTEGEGMSGKKAVEVHRRLSQGGTPNSEPPGPIELGTLIEQPK